MILKCFQKQIINQEDSSVTFETIPKTDEKHISISCGQKWSIDSMCFFNKNLDAFVKALDKGAKSKQGNFIHTKKTLGHS